MKTNHSTKWKYLLLFGLGSLVVGLSLLAFGAAAGGIEGIKNNTEATKTVRTFDGIKKLQVNSTYNITITSGDVDKVTVSYYTHKKFRPKTNFKQSGDVLTIDQTEGNSFVTGFMEIGGYILNEHEGKGSYSETLITVPKDVVLDDLSAQLNFHSSSLVNLKAKNINLNGATYIENLTAEKGTISSYSTTIISSHLKNMTFDYGADHFDFRDSTLEDSTFNNFQSDLSADNSHFKNISFKTSDIDLSQGDDYAEDYYGNEIGHLTLTNSTLENFSYTGAGEINGRDLTLKGKIDLSGSLLSADLHLTEASRKTTSLELDTRHGIIELDQKSPETTGVIINGDANTYKQILNKAQAELLIKSQSGYIAID